MPPKNKYSKNQIVEAAFEIAKQGGFDSVTIRKVAEKMGASIAPLYVNFKNLDELKKALAEKVLDLSFRTVTSESTHDPFLDIGAGILRFAMDYQVLFKDFMFNPNCRKFFDDLDKQPEVYMAKTLASPLLKGFSPEEAQEIGHRMLIVTSGFVFEYFAGQLPMDYDPMVALLEEMARDLIAGYRLRKEEK